MMLLALTSRPLAVSVALQRYGASVCTSLAVARACRPSLLAMSSSRSIMAGSPLPRPAGAAARGKRGVGGAEPGASTSTARSEEHTSELQSLMRISYAVFCLKKKKQNHTKNKPKNSSTALRELYNNT